MIPSNGTPYDSEARDVLRTSPVTQGGRSPCRDLGAEAPESFGTGEIPHDPTATHWRVTNCRRDKVCPLSMSPDRLKSTPACMAEDQPQSGLGVQIRFTALFDQ